jgi:hypothetical protein
MFGYTYPHGRRMLFMIMQKTFISDKMKSPDRFVFCCYFAILSFCSFAQKTDTVLIYKSKAGMPFRVYEMEWFLRTGSYTIEPKKLSAQDTLIRSRGTYDYYYKVYDKPGSAIEMEGKRCNGHTCLIGDLKYYYPNGKLRRIEIWHARTASVTGCDNPNHGIEALEREGTWRYYRKNGSLKKTIEFLAEDKNCTGQLDFYLMVTQYKQNGTKGKTKRRRQIKGL